MQKYVCIVLIKCLSKNIYIYSICIYRYFKINLGKGWEICIPNCKNFGGKIGQNESRFQFVKFLKLCDLE